MTMGRKIVVDEDEYDELPKEIEEIKRGLTAMVALTQ